MRDFLAYIPTPNGDFQSLAPFLFDRNRNFDVAINVWEPVPDAFDLPLLTRLADYCFTEPGEWWPTIPKNLEKIIRRYQAYAFICDDAKFHPGDLSDLFEHGMNLELDIWQASISQGSVFSWPHTIQRSSNCDCRIVPMVECMMPIFRADVLKRLLWTFTENLSGYGMDLLWAKHTPKDKLAVFDRYAVDLTRPVTSGYRMYSDGKTGKQHGRELVRKHNIALSDFGITDF